MTAKKVFLLYFILSLLFLLTSVCQAGDNLANINQNPNVDQCSLLGGDWVGDGLVKIGDQLINGRAAVTFYHSEEYGKYVIMAAHHLLLTNTDYLGGECQNNHITIPILTICENQGCGMCTLEGTITGTKLQLQINRPASALCTPPAESYSLYKSWLF